MFLADTTRDITIKGLTLDMNGANNLVPPGKVITAYGIYLYAAEHVTLQDVTMHDTPGQNYVVAQGGGSDIDVLDSTFHNGGTSLPGNVHQVDFSALYFTATGVLVDGATITHDQQPFGFSGGIELHGSSESVVNSEINKSWPAVYIGPDVESDLPLMSNTTVSRNEFIDCGRGVVFNALGTGAIDGVDIVGNVFRMVTFSVFEGEPARGIDQDRPEDGNWTYHHIITGLTVRANEFYAGDTASDAIIRLSQVHSATISDNEMYDVPGTALALSTSPWGLANVSFQDNDVDWRGTLDTPAVALTFDDASAVPPVADFAAENVSMSDNRITLREPDPGSCAVLVSWPAEAVVRDTTVQGNILTNISAITCGPRASDVVVVP